MQILKVLKTEIENLSGSDFIGDPQGQLAFAYIRVGSDEQYFEEASGLSRQLSHIHMSAIERRFKIPLEMVFVDVYTGFEFEGRPQLTALRNELKSPERRANVVVMEHLDRLSRNADWHQGFLLDEMKKNGVASIFWKSSASLITCSTERSIEAELMRALNYGGDSYEHEFDMLAENGCIGDPNGQYAYAYLCDGSGDNVEEGQTILSRQIGHIHTIAAEKGYKIPWEMVFAEVFTGFEFEELPQLTRLRHEWLLEDRRANVVVIEHPDRLSHDADWHQGFLLDEMKKNAVTPVFWKTNVSLGEWLVAAFVNGGAE